MNARAADFNLEKVKLTKNKANQKTLSMTMLVIMIFYLVAECWSARMMVSRQEVRLRVLDREVSQRDFKTARSYLHMIIHESDIGFNCTQ